ncbi:YheC/YheD family protein [Priestia megaterium]|uniref:putative amidoligase domain-containing protein n=1 Tax=Priestia megaterium TaxID=1404 RepID=UPI000BF52DAE|nr:YheC/YheD family protein [Priestia megaterium]MED3868295.1 YheC/YheD family protein [Priestia megaterium]PER73079.1 hypothetical protein CN492_20535 [Priestia megaterium]PFP42586.1 hypothetical protein COK03_05355 [Priestia megaterium]
MDPMREELGILSDKEMTLQTLNLNNIPSVELVDPKTCSYPVIGRKYGHHSGRDIVIVNTKDQAIYEGYDYFTKIYAIDKEYCLEVEGLSVKTVQVVTSEHVVFNEIPIRTQAFGWKLEQVNGMDVPEMLMNVAIRALYVTGAKSGFVKMGVLENGECIVTDINSSESKWIENPLKPSVPFSMGADVEFMLSCDGELLPASTFFSVEGPVGCDERQIEQDSGEYALVEVRPEKANSSTELFENIQKLIEKASAQVPYENIHFRAGSMPFSGYQCGGHIHFGIPLSLSLLRALDHYLAIPVALIEESKTAKLRRKTNHGGLGRYREKPYGFEYLTLSSWIIDPRITLSTLALAQLVATHHHELKSEFLFHPLTQRAYYQGNKIFLKRMWKDIKANLMKTSSYPHYQNELSFLFEMIEKEIPCDESNDIRRNWNVKISKEIYDRGHIIQIPKKLRLKYGLKEGQSTMVSAGKAISTATVHSYPFSFRHPNMVQLSKSLRDKLSLPKDWCPKLSASEGIITLGPIIGILANRPFERQTTYFHHLCRLANEKRMLVYVFEPEDIDWEKKLVKGTTINGEGLFPFPAVIYDRYFIDSRKNILIDEVRAKLQAIYKIPFVNSSNLFQLTGDKWATYELLMKEYEEFLPESRLVQKSADIAEMLDSYGEVYLKPLGGALSKGVMRIVRRPTGIFWFDLNKKELHQFSNMEELFTLLSPLMKNNPYLVQEGIRRKQHKDKNLEIRVYMQKNEKQIWLRTGMVARLTGEDVLTEDSETNMRLSKILNSLYPDPTDRRLIINQLAKISKNIVATVEEKVGPFGELAVDLCIDQYGSIKLLEINAKPDSLFSQIRAYKLRTLAGIRLLNYASSLAGYEEEKEDLT